MDQPYALVATDLDGTLLLDDLTVSPRTRAVLRELAARGVRHVIVTGRPAADCIEIFKAIGYAGLAVCGQGAQIYDSAAHSLIAARHVDRGVARSAADAIRKELGGVSFAVLTTGLTGRLVHSVGFLRPGEFADNPPVRFAELWNEPIDKVLIRHRNLVDDDLVGAVAALCDRDLAVVHSREEMVELLPHGVDKAVGLSAVAAVMGVDRRQTIAFGDMPNDIPMLRWSGCGVAMGNCHPALAAIAAEIGPSNTEDGVALVLERIFALQ